MAAITAERLASELARSRREIERYVDEETQKALRGLEVRLRRGEFPVRQHASQHQAGGIDRLPGGASLTVREIDLAPSVANVDTIEFTNGTVTDVGGGVVRVTVGGGANHNLLDGSVHPDTLLDAVTDGDMIIGNATPKWSSLAISVPAANVRNVLGVDNGELRPSWKAILDGTAPAAIGTAAAGTALTAAHRDHVHAAAHGAISTTGMVQTLILTAAGGKPATTSGCASPTNVEAGTNDVDYWVLDFDATTKEYAVWMIAMPDNWDGGTITARFIWTTTSSTSTHDVRWGLQGRSFGDAETIDQAWGTAQEVTDTATATAAQVLKSAATAAITLAGTPAGGELVILRAYRDPAHADDDMNVDARLMAIQIEYGISALSA